MSANSGESRSPAVHLRLVVGEGDAQAQGGGWETLATFVVEFQRLRSDEGIAHRSLVHHVEADRNGQWPGLVARQLTNWMLNALMGHTRGER